MTESSPAISKVRTGSDQHVPAGHLALELMHEIKNPLETLGNLTYLASQEADSPDQVRQYMHLAEEQVATLNRIASRVLGFARSSYDPQLTDVVDLVEAAIRIHQRTIQAKRIRLVKELPRDLKAKLHGDQILQVVSNLIANALDALPDGGTLALRLSRACRSVSSDGGRQRPRHQKRGPPPRVRTLLHDQGEPWQWPGLVALHKNHRRAWR